MKDLINMAEIVNQSNFQKSKDILDKLIKRTGALAEEAENAMVECCRSDELDARDQFAMLAAKLRGAQSQMLEARSIGGSIATGGITRSGST